VKRDFNKKYKLDIVITPGSHNTEENVNRQINDKERIAAAMENPQTRSVVETCIE